MFKVLISQHFYSRSFPHTLRRFVKIICSFSVEKITDHFWILINGRASRMGQVDCSNPLWTKVAE